LLRIVGALRINMHSHTVPIFHKTGDTFAAGAKTLPQHYFVSPELFTKEQAEIFSKGWLLVGHQTQVAKPANTLAA